MATAFQRASNGAFLREVSEDELTSERLNDLTSSDSRYIQQARQAGTASANRRGLLNSSISAGAAEREAIRAASPIAQADAQASVQAASDNQRAVNTKLNTDTQIAGQKDIAAMQIDAQKLMQERGFEFDLKKLERSAEIQRDRDELLFGFDLQKLDKQLTFQDMWNLRDNETRRYAADQQAAATAAAAASQASAAVRSAQINADSRRDLAELGHAQAMEMAFLKADLQGDRDMLLHMQDMERMGMDYEQQLEIVEREYGFRADLQDDQQEYLTGQQETELGFEEWRTRFNGDLESMLRDQELAFRYDELDWRIEDAGQERDLQRELREMQLSTQERLALSQSLSTIIANAPTPEEATGRTSEFLDYWREMIGG